MESSVAKAPLTTLPRTSLMLPPWPFYTEAEPRIYFLSHQCKCKRPSEENIALSKPLEVTVQEIISDYFENACCILLI
jgi:hypothetical protein